MLILDSAASDNDDSFDSLESVWSFSETLQCCSVIYFCLIVSFVSIGLCSSIDYLGGSN